MRLHDDYATGMSAFQEALVSGLCGMPGAVCHAGSLELMAMRAAREPAEPALTGDAPRGGIAARIRRIGKAIFHGANGLRGTPATRRVPA